MAKYCLTYDAKDALAWEPEELKLKLSQVILENKGLYLESPLANAILFEDGEVKSSLNRWNAIFLRLKEDIYYYLCAVAMNSNGDFFDRNEGDPDLDADYQELLERLED